MWQPAQPAAAASTCLAVPTSAAVCSAYVSAASAVPLQAKHRQTSIARMSALEQVVPGVRVLILQGLDARHKLTAVSRLSRTFRSLPALAFAHDSTADMLRPDCGTVHDSREPGGRQRLWALSLTVERAEQPGRSTLFTCRRSLRSIAHLATLEALHICMELANAADRAASMRCVLRSVLSLPSLRRLTIYGMSTTREWTRDVNWTHRGPLLPEADWTDRALPTSASLRYLTLSRVSLSRASVLRLCSLPLQSLKLTRCHGLSRDRNVYFSAELTAGGPSQAPRLLLPGPGGLTAPTSASGPPRLTHLTEMEGDDVHSRLEPFQFEHRGVWLFTMLLVTTILVVALIWVQEHYGVVVPAIVGMQVLAPFASWMLLTFSIISAVPVMPRDHPMFLPGAYFAVSPHGYTPAMNLAVLPPYALPCIVLLSCCSVILGVLLLYLAFACSGSVSCFHTAVSELWQ